MKKKLSSEIITPELSEGAIINDSYPGFKEDYLVLHCLLRKYKPKTVFEIGTNMGLGTRVIKNAIDGEVFSLDLPVELSGLEPNHPRYESNGTGGYCGLPYTQLFGDSMTFDFSKHECEAYFIDGAHDYQHPNHETKQILKLSPKLIIYHDADMQEVYNGIMDAFKSEKNYELFRVTDTRIAYAVRK